MSKPDGSPKFESAAEACKTISTEADNIKARADGISSNIKAALAALPWSGVADLAKDLSAQNKLKSDTKNILNIDLSSNDVLKISNDCNQLSSVKQINKLQWDPVCLAIPSIADGIANGTIKLKNIRQRNKSEITSKCVMQSLIDILAKKEANAKNLAALKVAQEAEGLLTNNETEKKDCNFTNKDMSSNDYLENIQKCNQQVFSDQTNEIFACGGMEDIVQSNLAKQRAECLLTAGVIKNTDLQSVTENRSESDLTQTATGITPATISASLLSSVCIFSIIGLVLSVLGYFATTMQQEGGPPGYA